MIAIGKSVEISELNDLPGFVKKSGARVISITSNATSAMAKQRSWILSHWQSSHDPSRRLRASRSYGETQISRFSHGWLLLRMVVFAFRKLKAF
jgi:D-arabinose 5-phosphate isomerase GutQ